MSAAAGEVRLERDGTVARITVDRPGARNALTPRMYDQLLAAVEHLDGDNGVRVAVLRGAGGSFIAGTDIAGFREFRSGEDGVAYERRLDHVLERVESVRVPTIAVVEGYALGGGLALAAACDLRLCTPDARFGVPIARTVGNCLSMANHARLIAHLGVARTKAMLLAGQLLEAQQAHAAGFVLDVVMPQSLDARVAELCERIASCAPLTLQVSKEAIRRIMSAAPPPGEDLIRRVYGSRDFREGVAAFLEKRAPRWEGR